jgi:hypothetical protein
MTTPLSSITAYQPWQSALSIFAVSFAVLWWNAAPSVTFHDSGEFAMAAASAGIPHPPGAPSWTILASAFIRLLGFEDPARGTNVFSGFCSALTLALICWLVQRWVLLLFPAVSRWIMALTGISASLILFHSPAFIELSTTTEQYTLVTMFLSALLALGTAMMMDARDAAGRSQPGKAFWMGLLWGLAIGNHLSQISLGLFVAWVIWDTSSGARHGQRLIPFFTAGFGLVIGLTVFLWVPIRSRVNPLIDYGNVKTLDHFLEAISRKGWAFRPLSEAPPGFVSEWMASYDPVGELGLPGLILAIAGLVYLAMKSRSLIGWLLAATLPYALGMLVGHMKQQGIDVTYIRQYGVTDYHLPVYTALAIGGGVGFGGFVSLAERYRKNAGAGIAAVWAIWLLTSTAFAVNHASPRHDEAPRRFIETVLAPLSTNAVVLVMSDNLAFMLSYEAWIRHNPKNLWVTYNLSVTRWIEMMDNSGRPWNREERIRYLTQDVPNPDQQPLRIAGLTSNDAASRLLFTEFSPTYLKAARWLIPAGYLFEVSDHPVSDAQVRAAEDQWRKEFPDARAEPSSNANRQECEAWALLHQWRGAYFAERQMWTDAEASFDLSLRWKPDNGAIWYCLADARERLGRFKEAAVAYESAIGNSPYLEGPRMSLGILYGRAGNSKRAEKLLLEELALNPTNRDALANLQILRKRHTHSTR